MDAHLEEEEINADSEGWSFTSKALLMSNVLVSLLIVLVLSFTIMGSGSSIDAESNSGKGVQANLGGEFNTEKPSGSTNRQENKIVEPVVNNVDEENAGNKPIENNNAGIVSSRDQNPPTQNRNTQQENIEDDTGLDSQKLNIVSGCLTQKIKGKECDDAFTSEDIIEYCDELENIGDRCFVMSALMNTEIEYCDYIEDPGLGEKCVGALSGKS